jgi:alcohol dehydrogenase class IV
MALAAFEAGCAFNNSSVTIIHGMSRPIGANFHIPHGLSNAVLLEACMQFVKEPISDKLAEIARFSGLSSSVDDKQATEDFFSALHQLLQVLNIPELKEIIPDHEQFKNLIPKMSSDAFISGSPSNTVYPVSVEDMQKIYHTLID